MALIRRFTLVFVTIVTVFSVSGVVLADGPRDASAGSWLWSSKSVEDHPGWVLEGDWASVTSKTSTGSTFAIKTIQVGSGELVCVSQVLAVDFTNDTGEVWLGVSGGDNEYIVNISDTTQRYGLHNDGAIWLGAGEQLSAEFRGTLSGDSCYLYANGVKYIESDDMQQAASNVADLSDQLGVVSGGVLAVAELGKGLTMGVCLVVMFLLSLVLVTVLG